MKSLADFINENKQVGVLYHHTTIDNLLKILESDILKVSYNHGTISFTRDKNAIKTIASEYPVRLEIDGDKLSNNYKIEPFQYDYSGTSLNGRKVRDEMEEQVFKDIKQLHKYIIVVNLYENQSEDEISDFSENWWEEHFDIDYEENFNGLYELLVSNFKDIKFKNNK